MGTCISEKTSDRRLVVSLRLMFRTGPPVSSGMVRPSSNDSILQRGATEKDTMAQSFRNSE